MDGCRVSSTQPELLMAEDRCCPLCGSQAHAERITAAARTWLKMEKTRR